ncbi:MAG: hypothetical protein JRG94_09795, partial [Deltaproteobacteria bacterium]|nr:hypothetical protein [Deltaproteobacteria bacterium]
MREGSHNCTAAAQASEGESWYLVLRTIRHDAAHRRRAPQRCGSVESNMKGLKPGQPILTVSHLKRKFGERT